MSNDKQSKTMQKQPKAAYRLEYAPISLAEDFPIAGGGIYRQPDKPITRLHIHDCLAPALHYMATHYMEPVRMAVLAKSCFMSLSNFRRLFNQTIKKTPFKYLTHMRIQMAAVLLADTDKTVLEISLATGYTTLSSFNRQFKAVMGVPPRVWRSQIAHSPPKVLCA